MAHKHNLFIVCEGLSGTGKTKFAKALSRKLNAVYFKTPPSPFNKLRNFIDKNFDFKNRYYFYLASVFSASEQIKEILKKTICGLRSLYLYYISFSCRHRNENSQYKIF